MVSLLGCGTDDSSGPSNESKSAATQQSGKRVTVSGEGYPYTIHDVLGRQVVVEKWPRRIISLAPANTELLFAIGAGERLVGATKYCNYPAKATEVERVGAFSEASFSMERIVGLRPDLVVAAGGIQAAAIESLERVGIAVVSLDPSNFQEIFDSIAVLGKISDCDQQSGDLIQAMQDRIENVTQRVAQSTVQRPRVFYQVWDSPLQAAGSGSFIGQVIAMAGGDNVFADQPSSYPHVSEELVLVRDPEVIIAPKREATGAGKLDAGQEISNRPGWANVSAVRTQRIYFLNEDWISRPGPRLVDGLEAAARLLHPNVFPHESDEREQSGGPNASDRQGKSRKGAAQ